MHQTGCHAALHQPDYLLTTIKAASGIQLCQWVESTKVNVIKTHTDLSFAIVCFYGVTTEKTLQQFIAEMATANLVTSLTTNFFHLSSITTFAQVCSQPIPRFSGCVPHQAF